MNYVWSGISGIDKKTACEALQKHGSSSNEKTNIKFIHFEEILKEISGFDDITILLNAYNYEYQKRAWMHAFEQVLQMKKEDESDTTILCMHLIYFRNNRYFSLIDVNLLKEYNLDGFITFIDDLYLIKKRIMLRSEKTAFKTDVRLRDIISWRSIELSLSDLLCSFLGTSKTIPNYILSVKQPVSTVYNLIFNPTNLKIYIAHPITAAKKHPELIEEIEFFKKKLHSEFTTFDPTTIDERLLTYSLDDQYPNWKKMSKGQLAESRVVLKYPDRWPVNHEPTLSSRIESLFPIEINTDEITEIGEVIDDNIENRDYRLISQIDSMVAYRPNFRGVASRGVLAEMHYARNVAFKPCQIYSPRSDGETETSPFKGRGVSYNNTEELLETLHRHNEQLTKNL